MHKQSPVMLGKGSGELRSAVAAFAVDAFPAAIITSRYFNAKARLSTPHQDHTKHDQSLES